MSPINGDVAGGPVGRVVVGVSGGRKRIVAPSRLLPPARVPVFYRGLSLP